MLSLVTPAGLSLRPVHASPSYQPHAPILIDGNAAFTPYNGVVGGDGTYDHPFLISGWNITAPSGIGILVQNTDAFFRVTSNYVGITDGNGTVLVNLNRGTVSSNTIQIDGSSSDSPTGVWVVNSTGASVESNDITGYQGVEVDSSDSISVSSNTLSNTFGITVSTSSNIRVVGNTLPLSDLLYGVSITASAGVTVSFNNIWAAYSNGTGIIAGQSNDINMVQNSIPTAEQGITLNSTDSIQISRNSVGALETDVLVGYSSNVEILGNQITYSSYVLSNDPSHFDRPYGLAVGNSGNISIVENEISGTNYGVTLESSSSAWVLHNNFIDSAVYQASDDNAGNSWDNGYPAGGNYWSDYTGVDNCRGAGQDDCSSSDGIGDTPYVFNFNQDNYPAMNPFPAAAIATSAYSDAGFSDGARHIFYSQSNYWLIYVPGPDFYYASSQDGVKWTSGAPLGISTCCLEGLSVTNDESHVYIVVATGSAIDFALGQLNLNGTITMDTNGGTLKTASYDGSSAGVRLSVAVDSDLHAFIAYQVALGCGLCVVDSSPPYTTWTSGLSLSLQQENGLNWPKIHAYGPGQVIVVSGDYSNVWNGSWETAIFLSGNNEEQDGNLFYVNGTTYLFGDYASYLGYYSFDGASWSTIQLTNVPLSYGAPPFAITYDSVQDKFVAFVPSTDGAGNGIIYQYSGARDSNLYQHLAIFAGRNLVYGTTSFETIVTSQGPSLGYIAFAWTETSYPYQIYTYITADNP